MITIETTKAELLKMLEHIPDNAIVEVYSDKLQDRLPLCHVEYSETSNRMFLLAEIHDEHDEVLEEEYKITKIYASAEGDKS